MQIPLVVLLVLLFVVIMPGIGAAAPAEITYQTAHGALRITPLGHGSVLIVYANQVIHVDPYSQAADYSKLPKADQIWITHEHSDHLDLKAINLIAKADTVYVANKQSAAQLKGKVHVLANGDNITLNGVALNAVPAYNIKRERSPGVKYHPKGQGNGYVADFGGIRIYIAGDTEAIPEMASLRQIDLAFLPINLPYTMTPEEAAGAARLFSPKVVVPYHQGDADPKLVQKALAGTSIQVKVLSLP